jgi:hypothetical protein
MKDIEHIARFGTLMMRDSTSTLAGASEAGAASEARVAPKVKADSQPNTVVLII